MEIIIDVELLSKINKEKKVHLRHHKNQWHQQIEPYILNRLSLHIPRRLAAPRGQGPNNISIDLAGLYYIELRFQISIKFKHLKKI